MAVLGRLIVSSAERLDLPDLLSIDSYTSGDFTYLLKGLVNNVKPYILKGFEVIDPTTAIGTQGCSINIADSAVFYPGSNAGSFFYGLPSGDPNAQPLVPELRKNAVNYVYLTFTTLNTSPDNRAFWDPDANAQVGGEFTQNVNTESVLTCQVNVSVGAFPANTIPIAIITVGAVVITSIQDARDMMFRLGTGGISPNPFASYDWPSLSTSSFQRTEPPTTMLAGGVNPFEGADKNILSLKDWMDAVMSKLKELGGTTYWYEDTSTFSLINAFNDSVTVLQSKGLWVHSASTPGLISWTEDIDIESTANPREYVLTGPGSFQLQNGQVAYLDLVRDQSINSTNSPVAFTNGQSYINTVGGSVGLFSNLTIGDWIQSASDPSQNFVQVVQFWNSVNASGSVTTAALAKSISISTPYLGSTINNIAVYDQGIYTQSDVIISNKNAAPIAAAGGNFFWLAYRSDNIETISNVATTNLSITISTNDGTKALVTSSTPHGLADSQRVVIAGTADYNGTYQVEVVSSTTFYIPQTTTLPVPESGTASYATVTTSANNGFPVDSTVFITDTTNYNGSYQVAPIDSTHFNIPVPSSGGTPVGSPNLATAATYGVLGASGVTNTGSTVVTGDLGTYPTASITGFPPGTVSGTIHDADAAAHTAQTDALAAYTDLSTRSATTISPVLDGQTLTAGVYRADAGHLATSGPATLTFNGSATDVFVIISASTITTGAGGIPTMTLTGGALASNVYWAVGSSATINSGSAGTFVGTVIAQASVTDTLGGTVNGRLIALTGAVTLSAAANITVPTGGITPSETSGTVTLAAVIVRTQNGAFTLYQGQSIPIDGTFAQNIPSFVDATPDYALPPGYNTLAGTENYNGLPTDSVAVRLSKLTGMMADKAQDKTIKYLPSGLLLVSNTTDGANQDITFTSGSTLTILQPGSPGNATITLPSASPGISLAANQVAYVTINRNAATTPSITIANTTAVPIDENVFVIAERLSDLNVYLWNGTEFPVGALPYAGSGTGIVTATYFDPITTTLPTGTVTEDGFTVNAGDLVLFANLGSGNNEIYKAIGTGTTITSWTSQFSFNGSVSPSAGSVVVITSGNNFANQIGEFNGTTWHFNNTVRYFNGSDYWEQSAIITSTLADNTTNGTVFSVSHTGSENMIVDYSIIRGTLKETGSLYITTDGTNVSVAEGGTTLNGISGVIFSGVISGANIVLMYSTTSTGVATTMKYSVKRWSDAAGGPGGIPSYSGSGGSGVTSVNGLAGAVTLAAGTNITLTPSGNTITIASTGGGGGTPAGPTNALQYNNAGALGGIAGVEIDTVNNGLNLNGMNQIGLSTGLTVADNTASPTTLFTFTAATWPFAVIEYSIVRNGIFRVGRLMVTNDTTITSESDDYVETNTSGITLSAVISGANVAIQYISTSTSFSGTLKYSMRRWS